MNQPFYTCPHYIGSTTGSTTTTCLSYINQGNLCGICKRPDFYRCLNDLGRKPLPLSHSSVQDFLTCHYLYYLKHIIGLTVKPQHMSTPIKIGRLWDDVLGYMLGSNVNPQATIETYDIDEVSVEKVRSLYRAYKALGITVESDYKLQYRFKQVWNPFVPDTKTWGNNEPCVLLISGIYDRYYQTYFAENKISSRSDSYLDVFYIQSQIATYFLANDQLEYCIMEVVRTPDMRVTRAEEDNISAFGNRLYDDIMRRPGHYFLGYDKERNTYGKKVYRSEFDLADVQSRYLAIFREIHEATALNGFYKNDRSCRSIFPGQSCDYLNVCRHGVASEEVYGIREKPADI